MRLKRATSRRQVFASSTGMPPEYTPGLVIERLTMLKPVITTSSQIARWPAIPTAPQIMQRFETAKRLASEIGYALDETGTGGGSDGNFTAALGVPTLDGLGIDGDGAHTEWEHGLISSIEPRTRLMSGLLETLQ